MSTTENAGATRRLQEEAREFGCWFCESDGFFEVSSSGCGLLCPICERIMVEP